MVYTLVTSAQEWLSETYGHEDAVEDCEETDTTKEEVMAVYSAYDFRYFVVMYFLS